MNNQPPKFISLLGQDLELKQLFVSRHSTCHPSVIIMGKPVVSIEYSYGELSSGEELKRAELAVQSFIDNDGKYSVIPDLSLIDNQIMKLSDELLQRKDLSIDLYNYFNQKHFVLESGINELGYVKFCIWDRALCETVYNTLREGKRNSSGRPYPTFKEFFDYGEV
ncbi:hypothetical protein DZF79_15705 [Vibrio parahaemolyticus]|nr:hypothetical protein [Vibrio parahaemolyticus]